MLQRFPALALCLSGVLALSAAPVIAQCQLFQADASEYSAHQQLALAVDLDGDLLVAGAPRCCLGSLRVPEDPHRLPGTRRDSQRKLPCRQGPEGRRSRPLVVIRATGF